MKKVVVFGAGNIGRSLVGQLFSRSDYEVVFVDVVEGLVKALNERKKYRIEVKDVIPETIWVDNVRAVHAHKTKEVASEIATADIMATAVGANNLHHIYGNVANGLVKRLRVNRRPIDIIICENIRNASTLFREGLSRNLPGDYPLESMVGLVETSIGKMVPIMTEGQKREDPLLILAEAYNKIILDKRGFKGEVPRVEGLEPKENIGAYVDRKLFIHNMGHAATAYLGYITDPSMKYIWEAIADKDIRRAVEGAMWESGKALVLEYPREFNGENIKEYLEDLIRRFGNRALQDTIYRVGRDVPRKISRNDRLIGALLLDGKHSVPAPFTTLAVAAAMLFRGRDHKGRLHPRDKVFAEEIYPRGIDYILKEICGLSVEREKSIVGNIKRTYRLLVEDPQNWLSIVG